MDSSNSAPVIRDSTALDVLPERTSSDLPRPAVNKRMSIRPGMFRAESDGFTPDSPNSSSSNALVSAPWTGSMRAWEFEIETALKSFYSSIKNEPLPLLDLAVADVRPTDRNLSVAGNLKRTGSIISKAPSDAASYRSKAAGLRGLSLGWQSRNARTRPKMYPASTIGSSRTSFDDNSSLYRLRRVALGVRTHTPGPSRQLLWAALDIISAPAMRLTSTPSDLPMPSHRPSSVRRALGMSTRILSH